MTTFPHRPSSHVTADAAVRLFLNACSPAWSPSLVSSACDYGLDIRVEIARSGKMTGEEFLVQVKGHKSVDDHRPIARIQQSTINYWLGKLHPTMIVIADTSREQFWFDWLEAVYQDFPMQRDLDREVALSLGKCSTTHSLVGEVETYLGVYFDSLRQDIAVLAETAHLSKVLLHTSALGRACGRMAVNMQMTGSKPQEEREGVLYSFFLEFGLHDQFLWSLWDTDSVWRRPVSRGALAVVGPLLANYVTRRSRFWMRERQEEAGNILLVPVRYTDLLENLLRTLDALWELEEALTQLVVLGRIVSPTGANSPTAT